MFNFINLEKEISEIIKSAKVEYKPTDNLYFSQLTEEHGKKFFEVLKANGISDFTPQALAKGILAEKESIIQAPKVPNILKKRMIECLEEDAAPGNILEKSLMHLKEIKSLYDYIKVVLAKYKGTMPGETVIAPVTPISDADKASLFVAIGRMKDLLISDIAMSGSHRKSVSSYFQGYHRLIMILVKGVNPGISYSLLKDISNDVIIELCNILQLCTIYLLGSVQTTAKSSSTSKDRKVDIYGRADQLDMQDYLSYLTAYRNAKEDGVNLIDNQININYDTRCQTERKNIGYSYINYLLPKSSISDKSLTIFNKIFSDKGFSFASKDACGEAIKKLYLYSEITKDTKSFISFKNLLETLASIPEIKTSKGTIIKIDSNDVLEKYFKLLGSRKLDKGALLAAGFQDPDLGDKESIESAEEFVKEYTSNILKSDSEMAGKIIYLKKNLEKIKKIISIDFTNEEIIGKLLNHRIVITDSGQLMLEKQVHAPKIRSVSSLLFKVFESEAKKATASYMYLISDINKLFASI